VDFRGEAEAGPGEDQRAHDQMVGERRLGAADQLVDLAHGCDVGLDVGGELGIAERRVCLDPEAGVAVLHVDGQ